MKERSLRMLRVLAGGAVAAVIFLGAFSYVFAFAADDWSGQAIGRIS